MCTHKTSDPIVAALAATERDELFPLRLGASVVDELTGKRPHVSALHRWARKGISGVSLQTVTVGRTRFSTRRWLIEFFAAVDEARRSLSPTPRRAPESASATSTQDEEDALARFGIGRTPNADTREVER